jgi:hypothetical protein
LENFATSAGSTVLPLEEEPADDFDCIAMATYRPVGR